MFFCVTRLFCILAAAISLAGCITTSMQGYADLQPPSTPIRSIAAIANPALIPALAQEAAKRGVQLVDARQILPPTRQYTEADVRAAMSANGIDGVLVVEVTGDTGVNRHHVGTVANTSFSGTYSNDAVVIGNSIYGSGSVSGSATTVTTPVYGYSRSVSFQAQLSDPKTSRKFWVGSGTTKAGGALFVGDSSSASDAAASIFNDLQNKGLIGGRSS